MKILVATEKPFAAVAVNGIREVISTPVSLPLTKLLVSCVTVSKNSA